MVQKILLFFKWFFISLGGVFLASLILSFTDIPFNAYYKLGATDLKLDNNPDAIIILGGSGMPSPDGLIRCYYGAEAALNFKKAKILIALPYNENDSLLQLNLMKKELIIRGIDSTRILFEPLGFNTHSQAENIEKMFPKQKDSMTILIVTSPEHMYRSVQTFKKVGFKNIVGNAAFEKPIDETKVEDHQKTHDARIKSLNVRYNMWSYLNYELLVAREYCAIAYYKLKGWI